MFSDRLKSQRYYNDNKKKFNKLYGYQVKKIVVPEYVGYCSYTFQEFIKAWNKEALPTVQDFADFYFTFLNPTPNEEMFRPESKYYGRSVEDLERLASHFLEMCDDVSLTLEQCFDDIVNHVIVETFNGQIREIMLSREYEAKGYRLEHTNGFWDRDLGVDFIVKGQDDTIKGYIQCKPLSFFSPHANPSCVTDRAMVFSKEAKKKEYCQKENLPYYPTKFVIYNTEHPDKWCTMDGRRGFLAEELMNSKGEITADLKKIVYS